MRTQECHRQVERTFVGKNQQSLEQTQLGRGLKTVACFCFDGGGTGGEHTQQAWTGLGDQGFNRGSPRSIQPSADG